MTDNESDEEYVLPKRRRGDPDAPVAIYDENGHEIVENTELGDTVVTNLLDDTLKQMY